MTIPKPANDNLTGATVRTPEEHRAIIAGITGRWRTVDAWPIRTSLRKRDPQLAVALEGYADAMAPYQPIAANDNRTDDDGEDGGQDFVDPEFHHEIRPTVGELIAAADGELVPSVYHSHGDAKHRLDVTTYQLGNVEFDGHCQLKRYQADNGNWYRPRELQRGAKGEQPFKRDPEDDRHLLANKNVPIARGAYFFAGKTRSNGIARRADNDNAPSRAVAEAERCAARSLIRGRLGDATLVLDMAITDDTAREIGERLGYRGKYAERAAMKEITAALSEFEKIAA